MTYTTVVSELWVWFTRNNSCRRPAISLSHATKSYRVNRPVGVCLKFQCIVSLCHTIREARNVKVGASYPRETVIHKQKNHACEMSYTLLNDDAKINGIAWIFTALCAVLKQHILPSWQIQRKETFMRLRSCSRSVYPHKKESILNSGNHFLTFQALLCWPIGLSLWMCSSTNSLLLSSWWTQAKISTSVPSSIINAMSTGQLGRMQPMDHEILSTNTENKCLQTTNE